MGHAGRVSERGERYSTSRLLLVQDLDGVEAAAHGISPRPELGSERAAPESGRRPPSRQHWRIVQSGELSSQKRRIVKTEAQQRRAERPRDEVIRYVDVVGEERWTLIERRWG